MRTLLRISAILAVGAGVVLVAGSVWAVLFTYRTVAREGIVTPPDAVLPLAPVRGPLTLHAQAEAIRKHTLEMTGGKTYAEMPRQVEKTDSQGQPVRVPNTARDIWVTATTLITALHLAIITYLFSGLLLLFGIVSLWTGLVFYRLS